MTSLKTSTTAKAAIAIVAAAISVSTIIPAQAAGPDRANRGERHVMQADRQGDDQFGPPHGGMRMGGGQAGLLALNCGPNGAERIEHALVALKYRTNPTGDQVALFDAFQAAALDAQKEFAATCDATLPGRPVADANAATTVTPPNILEAMQMRLKLEEARVAALGEVMPSFEAYFNSLSDEQKATLDFRGHRPGRGPAPAGAPDAAGSTERPS
ncbi:MAG TPA: Spy/CpxP family protein refolding chaperone [Devosia sp.]